MLRVAEDDFRGRVREPARDLPGEPQARLGIGDRQAVLALTGGGDKRIGRRPRRPGLIAHAGYPEVIKAHGPGAVEAEDLNRGFGGFRLKRRVRQQLPQEAERLVKGHGLAEGFQPAQLRQRLLPGH